MNAGQTDVIAATFRITTGHTYVIAATFRIIKAQAARLEKFSWPYFRFGALHNENNEIKT